MSDPNKIQQIFDNLGSDPRITELGTAVKQLDQTYLEHLTIAMRRNFVWLSYHREENTQVHNMLLYSIMSNYESLARYLDNNGINSKMPFDLFSDYPFLAASKFMDIENELFIEAGMYPQMVEEYWKIIDSNKEEIIRKVSSNFRFQDYTIPRQFGYLGPRPGNSWFDRVVAGVGGAIAIGANIVGGIAITAETIGLAAPLAGKVIAVSVAAGVVGLGHAATGKLTP